MQRRQSGELQLTFRGTGNLDCKRWRHCDLALSSMRRNFPVFHSSGFHHYTYNTHVHAAECNVTCFANVFH